MTPTHRSARLRIDLVSEHASPLAALGGVDAGGQNVHVAALATELGRLGHRVVVHTRRDDPALDRRVPLAPGVVVHHVDAGPPQPVPKDDLFDHMDEFADQLGQSWQRDRPDLAHGHFWMSGYAAAAAARPLDLPVVQTFHALGVVKRRHQGGADTSPGCRQAVEAGLLGQVARVVATCSDEVFELRMLGAAPEVLSVVPCGVDPRTFAPGPTRPRGRTGGPRLLAVGRLVERKGVDDAIAALASVPGAELVVAGGPAPDQLDADPHIARLRAAAAAAGVADRVRLLGRVPHGQLPQLYRAADVVVCAPWYEPFGIVPLEAMACGVPVVATAVGGMVDTVVDGVTGLHVPPREPAELAGALRHLLGRPDLRAAMGRAGQARVADTYTWARVAASTARVYRQVLGQRAAAAPRAAGARS